MTSAARLHTLLLVALAAALVVPGASADAGQVTAQKASYRGGATQAGECVAFFLTDGAEPGEVSEALLSIDIRAERFEALQIEQRFLLSPTVQGISQDVEDPRFDKNAPPQRTVLEKTKATLVSQQPGFQVHVVPADAAGSVPFTAVTDAGAFETYDAVMMDSGRFGPPDALSEDSRVPSAAEFWAVRLDRPLVVHDDQASQFQVTFQGDLVLEVWGATLEADERSQSHTLESGVWTEPAVPGLPVPGAESRRTVLLRIFLEGATVDIGFQGARTNAKWASPELTSTDDGDTILEGATGEVVTSDGEVVLLDNERYVLSPGTLLSLTPASPAMGVGVRPEASTATTGGSRALGEQGPALIVGVAAVLALLAAVALGVLRARSATPDLRQVELALEGQHYARAARLAKAILRSRPGLEDAVLGRAIALSKSGRAGAAISEIHDHLRTRGASDGSLHYVLGLSFLDVGRVAEARVALGEAVARTPALQADVAARLGHPADSMPKTLREVHGYA